jgi:hypothetical protein
VCPLHTARVFVTPTKVMTGILIYITPLSWRGHKKVSPRLRVTMIGRAKKNSFLQESSFRLVNCLSFLNRSVGID